MLKSIDPTLNADVLYALRAIGHGDDLVLCDTNFPADALARRTVLGRLIRMKAYCVIQTGERRFYGCFILKKGVIAPEAT